MMSLLDGLDAGGALARLHGGGHEQAGDFVDGVPAREIFGVGGHWWGESVRRAATNLAMSSTGQRRPTPS